MRAKPGFTAIEVVLVVAIMAILAAILVPIAMHGQREASETKLIATLKEFHTAVGCFVTDCGGYPEKLTDVLTATPPLYCRSVTDGSRLPVDPVDFRGPYLTPADGRMPKDPITGERAWDYSPTKGRVRSAGTGTALDGRRYSEL